jgi:DNA-binding response OmpR family regulator
MREFDTRRERIILVEDEEPIRDFVATALRFTGFTVETVATGPQGLALARNDAWHVLVLHGNLPGLKGVVSLTQMARSGQGRPLRTSRLTSRG